MTSKRKIIIISGLSGSGKSTVASTLEDEGYYVVDNLPLPLLFDLIQSIDNELYKEVNVAVVIDVRNRSFLSHFTRHINRLTENKYRIEILFLRASTEVLLRRYSETRRKHPLSTDTLSPEVVEKEILLLQTPAEMATYSLDTTNLTPHELKRIISQQFIIENSSISMSVTLLSFGYKYGIPQHADVVLDVRFLNNPYFEDTLRELSGLDKPVSDFVLSQKSAMIFIKQIQKMALFLLPEFQNEGRKHLTIAIGCTGGQHRSVAITDKLQQNLSPSISNLHVSHRDVKLQL